MHLFKNNPSRLSVLLLLLLLGPTTGARSLGSLIKNWGIYNDSASTHVHALDAWNLSKGSRKVIVAVIDTGIDPHHRDLEKNLWMDQTTAQKNIFGFDFSKNKPNPWDDHGHGTHIAGIIGAAFNATSGTAGVAQEVSIIPIKYYLESNSGSTNLKNTIQAIEYAIAKGAKIINYSGGGPEFSEQEYIAIKKAEAKGILFVAAAGNDGRNVDIKENYYYPAAYGMSNMISVAAINKQGFLLSSSNFGKNHVTIAAPGENIYSTLPGNRYGYMSGTSQATAFVTGVAALMLAKNPNLTPVAIKSIIVETADRTTNLQDKVASHGQINAYAALKKVLSNDSPKIAKPLQMTASASIMNKIDR